LVGGRFISNREGIHPALVGIYRQWPAFVAGAVLTFATVLALFEVTGAAGAFINQSFLEVVGALPRPAGFEIWQDLPTAFASRELELFGLVFGLFVVAALPVFRRVSWLAVLNVPVALILYSSQYVYGDQGFIPMAMGLLLVVNAAGLLIALALRTRYLRASEHATSLRNRLPRPEVFVLALALQYLAQFTFTGIIYSYLGAFLSLPVAIISLYALIDVSAARVPAPTKIAMATLAPALFGGWMVLMSIDLVQHHVYLDAPRAELTAGFQSPKLAGIRSTPANVRRVDGLVELVNRYSKPGDPIFAMPDFACIYFLTDRVNPTSQDWYIYSDAQFVPPSEIDAVLRDLRAHPPKVVILQTVNEIDWPRSYEPGFIVNYQASTLGPIYEYLIQHYLPVATGDGLQLLIPMSATGA
jgi:hypothetical protein